MENPVGGAIYAKVRTRFGQRLTAAQFRAMCSLNSVGEVAEFLRSTVRYRAMLRESTGNIHRGLLEKLIKQHVSADILELCAYAKNTDKVLSEIINQKSEIEQLLIFLRYFFSGHPNEFALAVSYTVNKTTGIDLLKLSDVKTMNELNAVLQGTPYQKWLSAALASADVSYSEIEAALLKAYYSNAYQTFLKDKKEKVAKLLAQSCEIADIALAYRIIMYYPQDRRLLDYAYKIPYKLKKDDYDRLLKAKDIEEFTEVLKGTSYGNIEDFTPQKAIEKAKKTQLKQHLKNIHFSSEAHIVLLSYAFYGNAEMRDIIHIIEGVRYGLSPEEISERLELYEIIRGENDG